MSGCRLSLKAYAKTIQQTATVCSLKTGEVLLDADGYEFT